METPAHPTPALFLGQHTGRLRDRVRILLPDGWRSPVASGWVAVPGFDGNILLLTGESFHGIYAAISALNLTDPQARLLSRMLLSGAAPLTAGEKGGLKLPAALLEQAGIRSAYVLVGQGSYIEVWAPGKWQQQQADLLDSASNASRFSNYHITVR